MADAAQKSFEDLFLKLVKYLEAVEEERRARLTEDKLLQDLANDKVKNAPGLQSASKMELLEKLSKVDIDSELAKKLGLTGDDIADLKRAKKAADKKFPSYNVPPQPRDSDLDAESKTDELDEAEILQTKSADEQRAEAENPSKLAGSVTAEELMEMEFNIPDIDEIQDAVASAASASATQTADLSSSAAKSR